MLIAVLAVVGLFVSLYLTLYKLGYIGTLSCSIGSCETVNTSRYSRLLGAPVAAWGVGFYVVMLGISVAGSMPAYETCRRVSRLLLVASTGGLLFSAYLTSLELFVIHAICMWCVISAILVAAIFVLSLLEDRATRA